MHIRKFWIYRSTFEQKLKHRIIDNGIDAVPKIHISEIVCFEKA